MVNAIKDAPTILDREVDQILLFDSIGLNKTLVEIFETELDDDESETSLDFTFSLINFDF